MKEELIKKALLTIKKECISNEDCEGCKILDILGLIACPCDSATFPEDWEIEREKDEIVICCGNCIYIRDNYGDTYCTNPNRKIHDISEFDRCGYFTEDNMSEDWEIEEHE